MTGLVQLRTTIESSLDSISSERLGTITSEGQMFATAGWFRLMQRIDMSELAHGSLELKFAVVAADGIPVSICPVIRARGPNLLATYSFRRYYFDVWIEMVRGASNGFTKAARRRADAASAYLRLLELTRCSLDDHLVVSNPFSYRAQVPVAPDSPVPRRAIYTELVSALQEYARDLNRPLSFVWVEGERNELRGTLQQAGWQPVLAMYDNYIPLDNIASLDDYVATLNSKNRWGLRREIKRGLSSRIQIRVERDFARHSETMSRLYRQTYLKHSSEILHQPPAFWAAIAEYLGENAEALFALDGDRIVGFSLLLRNERERELWFYRIGREYEEVDGSPYFWLAFYGVIQRAIESGCRTLWLGPGGYEAKLRRGAFQTPLENWHWFPKRRDRWLLPRYLHRFGEAVPRVIETDAKRPLRFQAACGNRGSVQPGCRDC